jgi:hypothetical protein
MGACLKQRDAKLLADDGIHSGLHNRLKGV